MDLDGFIAVVMTVAVSMLVIQGASFLSLESRKVQALESYAAHCLETQK